MFCPRCRQEYREAVTRCAECGVALVATLPPADHDETEWQDLVTVLETGDEAILDIAKSLLEAEGIPCLLQGARSQDLFGAGRVGTGFNLALGPIQLQVRPEDEDAALALLAARDLGSAVPDAGPEEDGDL